MPLPLLLILLAATALRVACALLAVNEIWPDEVFQTLEQGHRAAFGYGIVPWEFRSASRSWLLPGVLAGLMRGSEALRVPYRVTIALATSALSALPIALVYRRASSVVSAVLAALVLAGWFELIYFAPKTLSEVVAGHLLLIALLLPRSRPAWMGVCLGLACALRMHLAPAALLASVWYAYDADRTERGKLALSLGLSVLCAGMLDWLTWSMPFESYVNNFVVNVIDGKSLRYGRAPALAYLQAEWRVLSWGALPVLALAIVGARRSPRLAAVGATVLLTHSLLGHKEYRFIFPALAILITCAALGVAVLAERKRAWGVAAATSLLAVSAWRAPQFDLAKTTLAFALYPPADHWSNDRGALLSFARFSRDERTCGVGLFGVPWFATGGYAWLHRDVPIVPMYDGDDLRRHAPIVNRLVTGEHMPARLGPFMRKECWTGACAYEREGSCAPTRFAINEELLRRNE